MSGPQFGGQQRPVGFRSIPMRSKINDLQRSDHLLNLIRAREASEQMAASNTMPSNRILALSLSDILDARKSARSTKEIEEIAQSHGIDIQILQRVARFVNTPSIAPQNVTRVVGKDGEERTTMLVCEFDWHKWGSHNVSTKASWSEPLLDNEHAQIGF